MDTKAEATSRSPYYSTKSGPILAVLYQAIDPPLINGVRKPRKPGGYQDSGADIAFVLQNQRSVEVITPQPDPDSRNDGGWCFPDNEDGILEAIKKGATHLWANTMVFVSHPLQTSSQLDRYENEIKVIGQPPLLVENFDDKDYTNNLLRAHGSFTMPRSWTVDISIDFLSFLLAQDLPFPIVRKPIPGRGSQGVKVCDSIDELYDHLRVLSQDSSVVMLEEFLAGEEATVTVIPPSAERLKYWAMPVVSRFNHEEGVAPYNELVAVTANSRFIDLEEAEKDARYAQAAQECVKVAELLNPSAPIRIDIHRFSKDPGSQFALFDISMKPNMTGPGRPGREDQLCLTAIAAAALGWDYPFLLQRLLETARYLKELGGMKPEIS